MNDYSEVTCHLQRDVVNLIQALNDKKWIEAKEIISDIENDMNELSDFAWNAYCSEWINSNESN